MAGPSRAGHFYLRDLSYARVVTLAGSSPRQAEGVMKGRQAALQMAAPRGGERLASVTVAAYAFEFIFAYFAAQRVAVDSQLFRATGLIALAAFKHTADKLFLEFTDCFFEQDSSLDHHSDQRFQLIFHVCTLRSGASEWAIPWA
jgi:hypothetical protein